VQHCQRPLAPALRYSIFENTELYFMIPKDQKVSITALRTKYWRLFTAATQLFFVICTCVYINDFAHVFISLEDHLCDIIKCFATTIYVSILDKLSNRKDSFVFLGKHFKARLGKMPI